MRKIFSVILLVSVLLSCQDINRTPKPKNLIPEDKMVEVLTEISLLHGARSYNKTLMEEKGINPYPYLMDKFGIDSVQLVRSNNYYAENYKQYHRIYEKVKTRLESLLEEYDSIRILEEQKQDSIKRKVKPDTLRGMKSDSLGRDTIRRSLPDPISRSRVRGLLGDTIR